MIIPTLWIERMPLAGNDLHGQPVYGATTRERVVPIKLKFDTQHTTVRTDSAGSHGHAYEVVANVVILALPKSKIVADDVLTIVGNRVRVAEMHPRYTANGKVDHIEIHCNVWK